MVKIMKLSVIIPCYNEVATILEIVQRVKAINVNDLEVIVVDDASNDGSKEVLEADVRHLIEKIIYHEKNLGKGAALRSGLKEVSGDVIIVQDADLEYDPRNIPDMLKLIENGEADVVYGSRFMGGNPHRVLYFWHYLGNRFLTLLSNMFTNINLSDMETCYKMFRRNIIQSIEIKENRFGFEPEITSKIARKNIRIYEIGISYFGRTYREGKKIGWKDGFCAIYAILKYNIWNRTERDL
jgi:glycosyltransferase involved in cell wall biosynthesis